MFYLGVNSIYLHNCVQPPLLQLPKRLGNKLNLKTESLERPLQVEIANQEIIPIDQVCPNCDMEIEGQNFKVNLIPFKLKEFDVILEWIG